MPLPAGSRSRAADGLSRRRQGRCTVAARAAQCAGCRSRLTAMFSPGSVKQQVPEGMKNELQMQALPGTSFLQEVEEKVLVPLLSAQGRQAQDTFEEKIAYVLEDNFVTANYPPDEAGQHGTSDCPVLFMAPVKGGPRMAVKVGAYRKEAELDALVNLIFQRHRENSGNHEEKLKGLEGMQKVAVSLGFSDDYENMKLEPLAKRCAEKMELEPPPSSETDPLLECALLSCESAPGVRVARTRQSHKNGMAGAIVA